METQLSLHCDECKNRSLDWIAKQLSKSTMRKVVQVLYDEQSKYTDEEQSLWFLMEIVDAAGRSEANDQVKEHISFGV